MNPLKHTAWVAIELSNLCDWASIHRHCPLSLQDEARVLDTWLVAEILRELGHWDYDGYVAFHRYNEPLTDPRLYYLLEQRRALVPKASSYLCTNARYITEKRVHELAAFGVGRLRVSLYGPRKMGLRILEWAKSVPMAVELAGLGGFPHSTDILGIYEAPRLDFHKTCGAPLHEVVITCGGEVGLCCRDWKNQHTFGSLHETTLSSILLSDQVQETYQRLMRGDRFLDLCSRCKSSRI